MDERLVFPATARNKDHIGNLLERFLPSNVSVLEIASGSGEHGVNFQERFPDVTWQTSDPDPCHRKSISAWIAHQGLTLKMPQPLDLDVEKRPWLLSESIRSKLKGIICINMLHISPWSCTIALFEESQNLLRKDDFLMLYGPFKRNGQHTSESNSLFHESLRTQNSSWGIRNLEEVIEMGVENTFKRHEIFQMPANNLSVFFFLS